MNKLKLILLMLSVLFIGCNDDDDSIPVVNKVAHTVEVKLNENFGDEVVANANVILKNKLTSEEFNQTTNDQGIAQFELLPGKYTVNASIVFTVQEMKDKFGIDAAQEYSFNASQDIEIGETEDKTSLALATGKVGNIIIKQVYYAGSDVKEGASFRDQFIELYNNSNETIYLDGLCIAQLKDDNYAEVKVKSDINYSDSNDGSYDWSLANGNENVGESANEDYVYSEEVIQFPGSGNENELLPGQSVIVAATALNHKAPLVIPGGNKDGSDKVYEPSNPNLTIDLSNASFEAYFGDLEGNRPLDTDIDTPAQNMRVLYKVSGGRDLILDPFGRDAYIIFRANEQNISDWRKVTLPTIDPSKIDADTKRYLQIPNSVVIDGVDLQHYSDSKAKPTWLPASIDAGFIKGLKGKYSSESTIRKESKTLGNRVIYQDTNNSTNDFIFLDMPDVSSLN